MSELIGPAWLASIEKRNQDLKYGLLGLVPALGSIAALGTASSAILMRSPLFVQERFGQYGEPIKVIKIRTMKESTHVPNRGIDDPRVQSGFHRFLRATSIDEVSQVLNIIGGSMSFVGPRPLVQADLELMKKVLGPKRADEWWWARCQAKPGIISRFAWLSRFVDSPTIGADGSVVLDETTARFCEMRAETDLDYIEKASYEHDKYVIDKTFYELEIFLRDSRDNPCTNSIGDHARMVRESNRLNA